MSELINIVDAATGARSKTDPCRIHFLRLGKYSPTFTSPSANNFFGNGEIDGLFH